MQTLTIKVKNDFMTEFMKMIDDLKDNVVVQKDKNLELDPYFYERQKQLHQDLKEIEDGTAKMITHQDLWRNINNHLKTLNS